MTVGDWTHLSGGRPRARRAHRCFLCGEPIPIGEVHARRVVAGDGGIRAFRMHAECEAESRSWDAAEWEGFSEGEMHRPSPTTQGSDK
jgi:hypothetical protein